MYCLSQEDKKSQYLKLFRQISGSIAIYCHGNIVAARRTGTVVSVSHSKAL